MPDPQLPASRRLAELHDQHSNTIYIEGPERVALLGRNGVGKTRLLEALMHAPLAAPVTVNKPHGGGLPTVMVVRYVEWIGYLPQRLDHLNDSATVLASYRGALLVVSHDDEFLKKIQIEYQVTLIANRQDNCGSSLLLRKTAG